MEPHSLTFTADDAKLSPGPFARIIQRALSE